MNTTDFITNTFFKLSKLTKQHTPEILAGIGIGGFVTTAVLAVKATPEAINRIEEKKEELNVDKLTPVQTIKATWQPYAPAVITGVSSTLCIIGSVSTSLRRSAAFATAYELSKTAFDEYRAKVIDTIGEKKEQKIQDAILQDHVDDNPPVQNINIIAPGDDGKFRSLYLETVSNQYFLSTNEDVKYAINKGYDEMNKSWEESMSFYTWLNILDDKLTENLPDCQADMYMCSGWSRSTPYEGFTAEIGDPITVHGGKWDGCACFPIVYGEYPTTGFKNAY